MSDTEETRGAADAVIESVGEEVTSSPASDLPEQRGRDRRRRNRTPPEGIDASLYQFVFPDRGEPAPNEIRIATRAPMRRLIGEVLSLLDSSDDSADDVRPVVTIVGLGRAMGKTISVAEIVKRRQHDLHQVTKIEYVTLTDRWEPIDPDSSLEVQSVERRIASIRIQLCSRPELLDTSDIGYQPPNPNPPPDDTLDDDDDHPPRRRRGRRNRNRRRKKREEGEGDHDDDEEEGEVDGEIGGGRGRGRRNRNRRRRNRQRNAQREREGEEEQEQDPEQEQEQDPEQEQEQDPEQEQEHEEEHEVIGDDMMDVDGPLDD